MTGSEDDPGLDLRSNSPQEGEELLAEGRDTGGGRDEDGFAQPSWTMEKVTMEKLLRGDTATLGNADEVHAAVPFKGVEEFVSSPCRWTRIRGYQFQQVQGRFRCDEQR